MKRIFLLIFAAMLISSFVSAINFEINFTTTEYYLSSGSPPYLQLKSLRYEPYPANPEEYITLWIKAENVGGEITKDARFELIPKYPFSLDANENPVRVYGKLNPNEPIVMKYKIRVDKDAIDGANEIEMRYKTGNEKGWQREKFEIEVENAQTDFDLVVQEVNGEEVSIAIANIGQNVAYSVIVRIPEQEDLQAIGVNGQMVGNLEDGDYTLVGFEIAGNGKELEVQIDYTDEIGERRSVVKSIKYNVGGNGFSGNLHGGITADMTREERIAVMRGQNSTPIYQKWWFLAIIIVLVYAGWKGYKTYKRKKEQREEKKHKK